MADTGAIVAALRFWSVGMNTKRPIYWRDTTPIVLPAGKTEPMNDDGPKNEIRELSRVQRRVIGVLMEKGSTTPEQYPLTLKALTTGCNQKSNRDPVTNYSEDEVQSALEELREKTLVAEVFTDGGRTPRYRHYMRYRYDFTEVQFAIIAELLLRGAQQLGELRTRASRMSRIESQEVLREALTGLKDMGFIRSSGPLERRGIQVDHAMYEDGRAPALEESSLDEDDTEAPQTAARKGVPSVAERSEIEELRKQVERQQNEIRELQQAVAELRDLVKG